jgi:hypothetical protein
LAFIAARPSRLPHHPAAPSDTGVVFAAPILTVFEIEAVSRNVARRYATSLPKKERSSLPQRARAVRLIGMGIDNAIVELRQPRVAHP